jgi:ATP-dependent DNA helicase RecQ
MEEFREAGRPEARQPELKRPEAKRPEAAEIRFYHAGLSREEKTAVEKWFFDNPRGILVSTCAYGMGVDKADIRTVIHRDCPPSVEAYLQESGRAGRDGKASEAILLWGPGDERPRGRSETERRRMAALLAYARDGQRCRREALLRLLDYESSGDRPETRCCDVCDREEQRPETGAAGGTSGGTAKGTARRASRGREKAAGGLREEGPLLDFFRRNRRTFTQKEAVRVLSAAENIRWTEEDAKQAVKELIRMKKLKISRNPLWRNKISVVRREELEGRRENWKIAPFASIARERASETADNKTPHSSLLPPPSQLFFFQPQFVIGAFLTIFGFV